MRVNLWSHPNVVSLLSLKPKKDAKIFSMKRKLRLNMWSHPNVVSYLSLKPKKDVKIHFIRKKMRLNTWSHPNVVSLLILTPKKDAKIHFVYGRKKEENESEYVEPSQCSFITEPKAKKRCEDSLHK